MADFIDPSWIKTSDYPTNFLPAGSIAIDQASENGDCTVKGFYDPATGEYHIQEVVHNWLYRNAACSTDVGNYITPQPRRKKSGEITQ